MENCLVIILCVAVGLLLIWLVVSDKPKGERFKKLLPREAPSPGIDVEAHSRPPRWAKKARSMAKNVNQNVATSSSIQGTCFTFGSTALSAPSSFPPTNINVSDKLCGPQSETNINISSQNSSVIMAGSNDIALPFMRAYYTTNNGGIWTICNLPLPKPLKPNQTVFASDPTIGYNSKDGNFYYGYVIIFSSSSFLRTFGTEMGITQINPNTGQMNTWFLGFLSGSSPSNDKPMLTVNNNASSPKFGNVYLAWDVVTNSVTSGNALKVAELIPSTGTITILTASTSSQNSVIGATIAIGTDDVLYVAWHDDNANGKQLLLNKTPAGQFSFPNSPVAVTSSGNSPSPFSKTTVAFDLKIPPQNNRGVLLYPVIQTFAPQSSPSSVILYMVWLDQWTDGKTHLWFAISSTKGSSGSWSVYGPDKYGAGNPVDSVGINSYQFMPWLSVDAGGNVYVVWYDTRNDPANNVLTDVYFASWNGIGSTPSFSVKRVTGASSNEQQAGADANQYGDYQGLCSGSFSGTSKALACWTDSRFLNNQGCTTSGGQVGEEIFTAQLV